MGNLGFDGSKCTSFVVATFIVEPWKRSKLVSAFEDKVKQVLVGISQENEQILDQSLKN